MKQENLIKFAAEVKISIRTLKAKYGDCIYREGRQTFIDRDEFESKFQERSRQGKVSKKVITKLTRISRLDFHLDRLRTQIEKYKRIVAMAKQKYETTKEPAEKEIKLLVYLDKQKNLRLLKVKNEKINDRKKDAIEKARLELSEYDSDGLLVEI